MPAIWSCQGQVPAGDSSTPDIGLPTHTSCYQVEVPEAATEGRWVKKEYCLQIGAAVCCGP